MSGGDLPETLMEDRHAKKRRWRARQWRGVLACGRAAIACGVIGRMLRELALDGRSKAIVGESRWLALLYGRCKQTEVALVRTCPHARGWPEVARTCCYDEVVVRRASSLGHRSGGDGLAITSLRRR